MHYNWPKFEYIGDMSNLVFTIYPYEVSTAPNWALFQAREVPALSSIQVYSTSRRLKQVQHGATHPPGQVCGTIRTILPWQNPTQECTDRSQGEIWELPHTRFSRYLHQMKFEMNVRSHPIQEPSTPTPAAAGPFSHYETPSEASTDEAQGENQVCSKIQCLFPLRNPTQGSRDKGQGETQTYTGTQKPSPQTPMMTAMMNYIRYHTPAVAGSFFHRETQQGPEQNTGARTATQDPNPQVPSLCKNPLDEDTDEPPA
ncbi:hypothetical protein BS47DRAFT_1367980 [Hydnum rufescens UP504]|uniref:Uncharacterized protein n=1 Tax=Hydnum rufescens UP504 TaxID=1448309 RepID=A0A9P6AHR9_9AGAM|nr:hypothetical protein BS47DRAFT_1367980 [Hydnum rufescens UP504]